MNSIIQSCQPYIPIDVINIISIYSIDNDIGPPFPWIEELHLIILYGVNLWLELADNITMDFPNLKKLLIDQEYCGEYMYMEPYFKWHDCKGIAIRLQNINVSELVRQQIWVDEFYIFIKQIFEKTKLDTFISQNMQGDFECGEGCVLDMDKLFQCLPNNSIIILPYKNRDQSCDCDDSCDCYDKWFSKSNFMDHVIKKGNKYIGNMQNNRNYSKILADKIYQSYFKS